MIESFSVELHSMEDTQKLAERLAATFKLGDWIWLEGPLGVGKTTLVRSILKAWGYEGAVTSPSYLLMNEYWHEDWGKRILHLDGFRLMETPQSGEMPWDWREWEDCIVFAEWPEGLGLPLGRFHYKLQLSFLEQASGETRRLCRLILPPFS